MRSAASLALVASAFCVALTAQERQPADQPPVFRASTRLIEVSVVVRDRRGRPVTGLTREDFQIFENRIERPVSLMAVRAGGETEDAAAERGVFTNRLQSTGGGGVVAVIFDRLNTTWPHQRQALNQILKFLSKVDPKDRIALYVLHDNGIDVLHDFTRDASSLIKAIQQTRAGTSVALSGAQAKLAPIGSSGATGGLAEGLERAMQNATMQTRAHYDRVRADVSLESLELIARHLAGVPGRKNLVWVGSGFPYYVYEVGHKSYRSKETRRAGEVLSNSDMAVYPVDARGIMVGSGARLPRLSGRDGLQGIIDGVRYVADLTGGRAFFNTNDISGAIARAVEDSRFTYILGYYPADQNQDGKFREIKVKVRRPGVEVRHRLGYYAVPLPKADPASRERTVAQSLGSPLEATGLELSITAGRRGQQVQLAIQLPAGTPLLQQRNGKWHGSVDLVVAQKLPSGATIRAIDTTVPLALDARERTLLMSQPLQLDRTINLRAEAGELRVIARDSATGLVGSVFIPVQALRE